MSAPINVTQHDFQEQVLTAPVPVLVDFWADWCGPCKAIAPVLDKLATEYGESLTIAKVNVDEEQEIATALGIRSLPTMMLFVGGQPVEQIVGAQPEANIRAVIDQHINAESVGADAGGVPNGFDADGEQSVERLEQILADNPDNSSAIVAIARIRILHGELDAAETLLDSLQDEDRETDEAKQVFAALAFARLSTSAPGTESEQETAIAEPTALKTMLQRGDRRVAEGDYEGAADQFLEVLQRDRQFDDQAGRKRLLLLFDLLGPADERVAQLRRRMMSALY